MKHARKLATLLLALVMVFAVGTTAFAAQEGELTGGSLPLITPLAARPTAFIRFYIWRAIPLTPMEMQPALTPIRPTAPGQTG